MADDATLVAYLRARAVGPVHAAEPLARHTTLKVGGPAAALVQAEAPGDFAAVAQVCAEQGRPWLILGRGSNLLVADGGWAGVVVTLGRAFRGVRVDGERVEAGAAEPMPVLANAVARSGLGGLEFGVAIPGSLGGAVRMNAGAHGHEIAEVLEGVEVARLNCGGGLRRIGASELSMGYRASGLPWDAVVTRAWLRLRHTDPTTLAHQMQRMRQWRRDHQPINEPSCGSVFRNPPGDSAGRLVEQAGMKGYRVGGAAVSAKHANFITVLPGATAGDVHEVILAMQEAVARRAGVSLHPEVVLAGFDGERR